MPQAKKTLRFPALPTKDGEFLSYSPSNSPEENEQIVKTIEAHLSQVEFLDNSQIYVEDYDIEDEEELPTLTTLSNAGDLEKVKISPDGKLIRTNDEEKWWKNYTILNHRKFFNIV